MAFALVVPILAVFGGIVAAQEATTVRAVAAQPADTKAADSVLKDKSKSEQEAKSAKAKAAKDSPVKATSAKDSPATKKLTMAQFLDRLMHAESSGRDNAANPRSSARGAFQFIKSTFLFVARRHFTSEVANLSNAQILALRYNREFSRKAARAYSEDNAAYLTKRGAKPTFVNLRLAFLLGPYAAARVVTAPQNSPIKGLLTRGALKANPFMRRMTAGDLIARAARDLSVDAANLAGLKVKPGRTKPKEPLIKVLCNLSRPSCRRWLALQKRKLKRISLRTTKK